MALSRFEQAQAAAMLLAMARLVRPPDPSVRYLKPYPQPGNLGSWLTGHSEGRPVAPVYTPGSAHTGMRDVHPYYGGMKPRGTRRV